MSTVASEQRPDPFAELFGAGRSASGRLDGASFELALPGGVSARYVPARGTGVNWVRFTDRDGQYLARFSAGHLLRRNLYADAAVGLNEDSIERVERWARQLGRTNQRSS